MKKKTQWVILLDHLRSGADMSEAATMAGMDRKTPYARMKRDPKFRAEVEKAQLKPTIKAITTVQSAMADHWQAAAWWLERQNPERFGLKEKLDVTSGGQSIADVMRSALRERVKGVAKGRLRRPGLVLHTSGGNNGVEQAGRNGGGHQAI